MRSGRLSLPAGLLSFSFMLALIAGMSFPASDAQAEDTGSLPTGTPVSFVAADGSESFDFALLSVIDPYQAMDDADAPEAGSRFVAIELSVTNTGAAASRFNPATVQLLHSRDRLARSTRVTRSATERAELPDLAIGSLDPGATISGWLFYEIPADATVSKVLMPVGIDYLVTLSETGGGSLDPEAAGEPPAEQVDLSTIASAASISSDEFEFALAWDPAIWSLGSATRKDGFTSIRLDLGATSVFVEAIAGYGGDPQTCLANTVEAVYADPEITGFAEAKSIELPNSLAAENASLYTYQRTDAHGNGGAFVLYVECRALRAGESVLLITSVSHERYYEIDRDTVSVLLEGIAIPEQ